eukprot:Transcript_7738.p1 GENE.Transcript_7738~~Transcript_7738.p1  ORF type:complete len:543 (+),score=218.20 Transcript_7738:122-1750(+)
MMVESKFVWGELGKDVTTSLPFLVKLDVLNEHDEPMSDYAETITITAVTSSVHFREGFESRDLGGWTPAFLPGHYEHGFDSEICAPGSSVSLYLRGGNDSNFGMTLKLPAVPQDGTPGPSEGAEGADEAAAAEGGFRPQSVSFYVRTDNERADAGHFILGESNEVNKRVAQFQFTKDGKMGLLGTGGITHGATPYEANRWYFVELRFDWEKKEVSFYVDRMVQQRHIPFRRGTSSYIGACALGNRDRCTTWFDSVEFCTEAQLCQAEVEAAAGHAEAWVGPMREDLALGGFVLRAEDSAGHVSVSEVLQPLSCMEGAQRGALNAEALSEFSSLLSDSSSSDVCFLVEGRAVHAHRCILTARCEAFRLMFNSAMREGSAACPQVPIKEASFGAFQCVLQYIYGGAVQVPEELAVELLGLADRYLLDGLKILSGFTLARMVSVDTVCRIIQAADRWDGRLTHTGSQLKQLCLDFILANYEQVVRSPTYEELTSSPHLLLEITRAAAPLVHHRPAAASPFDRHSPYTGHAHSGPPSSNKRQRTYP